jgi:hypothetical protein
MENTTQTPASGGWKVMGIISLVLGGLSIILSFIPCVGGLAVWSGIIATILSIIALVMANNAQASKSIAIIALLISIASIGVGYWRAKQLADALGSGADKLSHTLDSLKNSK